MTKHSKKFVQPGSLTQEKTKYEKLRQKNIEENAAIFKSLGLKSFRNGMFGSSSLAKKKSRKQEKSKIGSRNDDKEEEYQPGEGEEGMGSSSEGVVTSRLQGNKVCRAPRKKGGATTHIPRGENPILTGQGMATRANYGESMPEVVVGQPMQFPTSSAQPLQSPSPAPTSLVVKKHVRGPTRGKNIDKVRKELGHPIPVDIDHVALKLVGKHSSAVAAALGEQIRDHAPVRDIRWKAIDFGIRESIVVRVGQTFDIGDYKNDMVARETIDRKCQTLYKEWKNKLNRHYLAMRKTVPDPENHALYPCKPEDWVFMIDNVWQTKDWETKSARGKHARSNVRFNHTSGSRSFISRASMILKKKGKSLNIAEKFKMTHIRHRHGGEWINDEAQKCHTILQAKLKEQSQPNATNPSSKQQVSIDVLGKRSVYVKEYGSSKSTISPFNQPQEPNPDVIALQKKVDHNAKTMTVVKGLLQVLAVKAGVDPAEVQEVINACNGEASTSGEEVDAEGASDESNTLGEEDGEESISDEDDDAKTSSE